MKRILFYFLSFTWGILISSIGLLAILVLLPFKRVRIYHGRLCGVIGQNGGGLNLGCFFLVCANCGDNDYVCSHECGHGLQNIIGGPLMPFIIVIPSAIRYGYRELKYNRKGLIPPTEYDDIWFEGQATRGGQEYIITNKG